MRWDLADFDNYLKSSGATDKCPFCPSTTWDVTTKSLGRTDLDIFTVSNELLNGDGVKTGQTLDSIPFICSNCGFVRLVSYSKIKDWKKKQVKEEDVI
ncbi:hypothetical protein ACQ4WP_27940 [Janthinobacterium sp. GB4P2]|jgi:hypothetical protein|uniref:hypothetical protein n=1 Tax=Janthinobacterium sp. GB4P2 TaxID=3424189 RepID=UPI003F21A168